LTFDINFEKCKAKNLENLENNVAVLTKGSVMSANWRSGWLKV